MTKENDTISRQAADKAEDFELNFTLHHPITDEEWDAITDVDFDHTEEIFFHTKHGKEVEFVKRKKGKWISKYNGKPVKVINGIPQESCACSLCGKWLTASDEYGVIGNYCPNCGSFNGGEDE